MSKLNASVQTTIDRDTAACYDLLSLLLEACVVIMLISGQCLSTSVSVRYELREYEIRNRFHSLVVMIPFSLLFLLKMVKIQLL